MLILIAVLTIFGLATFAFMTVLSPAQVNKRIFRRAPIMTAAEFIEGLPTRVVGVIETDVPHLRSPIAGIPAVRVHVELSAFLIGGTREDYLFRDGTPAILRDANGERIHVDFGAPDLRVRFIRRDPEPGPIEIGAPSIAALLEAFGIDQRCRSGQITPLGAEALVKVGAEATIRGIPSRRLDGSWELKPVHSEIMVT